MPTTRATLQLFAAAALVLAADSAILLPRALIRAPPRISPISLCAATGVQTLQLHGISVSPCGLVALLRSEDSNSLLPLTVTAEDTERATTPEALTLLQLMQGIDLAGVTLRPELLKDLAGIAKPNLRRVTIDQLSEPYGSLTVDPGAAVVPCPSAFELVALALRYGVPIDCSTNLLSAAVDFSQISELYPLAFSCDDAQQIKTSINAELGRAYGGVVGGVDGGPAGASAPPKNANAAPRELLEKALKIAQEKGDLAAELKIVEALRERGDS